MFLFCLWDVHRHSLVRRSLDKLAIAPVDSYLPAAEDDFQSGFEEGSGEGGGEPIRQKPGDKACGEGAEEGGQFDLLESSDKENLLEEETEPSLEEILVEEEKEGSAEDREKAKATFGHDLPKGYPANLSDSPSRSKESYCPKKVYSGF